jgi:hypothetical protein
MSGLFSYQVFVFGPDYLSSLDGSMLKMKILVKKSLRQKSLAEKNSSHFYHRNCIFWKKLGKNFSRESFVQVIFSQDLDLSGLVNI